MKAFDYLVTLDKKKYGEVEQTKLDFTGASASYGRKVEILKNNIFGVDLDSKAVEIAQLNLLLKAAEKKHRLPTLQENIKVGNSLIDDSAIAGDKAFKWGEQFKDIMQNGGFDVVIGNPPYGATVNLEEKKYFKNGFISSIGKYDSYYFFIEKAIRLLAHGGYLGFIVPDTWLTNVFTKNLREYMLSQGTIIKIISLPQKVFSDANVDTCIIILVKGFSKGNKIKINIMGKDSPLVNLKSDYYNKSFLVSQESWNEEENKSFNIYQDTKIKVFISKIKENCNLLGNISEMRRGCFCYRKSSLMQEFGEKKGTEILERRLWHSDKKVDRSYKKELLGSDIGKYHFEWKNKKWFKFGKHMASYVEPRFFDKGYIAIQRIRNPKLVFRMVATYIKGEEEYYASSGLTSLIISDSSYDSNYILAILNSKLLNWYYKQFYRDVNIKPEDLRKIPIKVIPIKEQNIIASKVREILDLNNKLVELKSKQTDFKAQLEKEIQKLDNEIDEEVYQLYGITEEEKKIIEES